ncbi:MAG: TAXI family TRAP transporter solute-binding subunit [Elusimicrobiota bacterium]|jgi:TRAP transporter TAXI family solute receptor|nr:TAXI family TRAP transporter solute-binding subunit [Elusimicrobiota bacterium]
MKKKIVAMLSVLMIASFAIFVTAAPSSKEIPIPKSVYKYSVAGGSIGGNFYVFGGAIAQILNNHLPKYFLFTAEATGGGTANLTMIENGDAELGIAMTSSLYEAVRGEGEWTAGKKYTKLRGIAPLYPSWLTIYTLRTSGIKSLKDFNGKRIGLGSRGASMNSIFRQFLADEKIVPAQIHNDGHGATATALNNGVIDAALLFSYPPFPAIAELESSKELYFVPLTSKEQNDLVKKYPFYSKDAIPAGSYKGTPKDVPGVSEWNLLVGSSDIPEDLAYLITKTLFENQADLVAVHNSAKYMTPANESKFNIPLHAGTVRYLKEIGVKVPKHLIPPEYKD